MSPMNNRLLRPRSGGGATDADARAYIQAVQTADGQALEPAVVKAIDDFVIGCKADGIWSAIGSSCILMGARTLNGIMTPLVGTAPSPNAFQGDATDYNRKTGLLGNKGTKHINTNRAVTVDNQNNCHIAVYVSTAATSIAGEFPVYIGGANHHIGRLVTNGNLFIRSNFTPASVNRTPGGATGLLGASRSVSGEFVSRVNGSNELHQTASSDRGAGNHFVFNVGSAGGVGGSPSNARIAFYSLGSNIDLALLDTRVSALYTAIGAASI